VKTRIVEATNGPYNWGKFLVGTFDAEWSQLSVVDTASTRPLLAQIGHPARAVLVLDLQTGEGAVFNPSNLVDLADPPSQTELAVRCASSDLSKHQIWVCPLFEPFLAWLYTQPFPYADLPEHVVLDAPFAVQGCRRIRIVPEGPGSAPE
jgi:hypothetical protein